MVHKEFNHGSAVSSSNAYKSISITTLYMSLDVHRRGCRYIDMHKLRACMCCIGQKHAMPCLN